MAEPKVAYVSVDGKHITDGGWTHEGQGEEIVLMRVTKMTKRPNAWVDGHRSFIGSTLYNVWAVDPQGQHWYGIGFGTGMSIRLKPVAGG